ncbi:hypothetical protein [Lacinutrix jangbogonensis]|uniref:hypothetical protein n=1 Tax=Lacinutrix jangbogonensis TaxID=1469557 RepID=UPI00053E2936|nr:hypothetical protein [Lacinutrix jangbogonensis]
MNRLIIIVKNTLRGFAGPAFNFLIVVFGVKTFGKTEWANLIDIMLWVFFVTFIFSVGNYDYLLRKYSEKPADIYHSFFSNFFSRSLLLPLSLVLFSFFHLQ